MAKRLSSQERNDQAIKYLINEMFKIAGHDVTYDDIKDRKDEWYREWTMTVSQGEEWKSWGVNYLRKSHRMSKKVAEREMLWVNLQWGLMYSDYDSQ